MNRVLRMCGSKREEGTGDWRKLHSEELHEFHSSPNIQVNSRKMRWAGHVARVSWLGNLRGKDHS